MTKNVAEQLVDMLVEAGIKRIYAVTGDSLNHLNDAVRRNDKIKWIHVRHEEVGAYAAAAEAELSDGLACCAGSCGPGHVHLINGLYDANKSHVPVLAIASTINTNQMGVSYFQDTNTTKLFDDCSVYNQMITSANQAQRIVQTAMQHAISKKGVAVIGLPGDVSEQEAVESNTAKKAFIVKPQLTPNPQEIEVLANVINQSQKITLFCGFGAKDALAEIIALAEKIKAPIAYTFRSKMHLQPNNPFEIGMTGLLGQPTAFNSMHESDLLLLLGTDFPYNDFLPTDLKIIQLDTAPELLGRRCQLDYGFQGDVKQTLQLLNPLIKEKEEVSFLKKQLELHIKVQKQMQTFIEEQGSENSIQPEYLASLIDQHAQADAIFTLDTGMTCVWAARFINNKFKRQFLGSFNHGSMANAMPMAIGASLAHPEKQVFALCGDGGISMLLGDLATIKQYNLPIKIIVFNNRSLGMVKLEMEVQGLPDNETDLVNPDFALVAQAMGFAGVNIHDPATLEEAIVEALKIEGPVLLNVFTNPNALAMPPKVEWNQILGMTKSMSKLMLVGRFDEVWDTVKSNYKHLKGPL